jgi:hypothetical protein
MQYGRINAIVFITMCVNYYTVHFFSCKVSEVKRATNAGKEAIMCSHPSDEENTPLSLSPEQIKLKNELRSLLMKAKKLVAEYAGMKMVGIGPEDVPALQRIHDELENLTNIEIPRVCDELTK